MVNPVSWPFWYESNLIVFTSIVEALLIEKFGMPSVISTIRIPFSSKRVTFFTSTGLVLEGLPMLEMTKAMLSLAWTPVS
jgi:hypothetical protein